MKIGYADFVSLCMVNSTDDWLGNLSVREEGVYIKAMRPDVFMLPQERAVLAIHPTGNLLEPALAFPCSLIDFKNFLESQGARGYIDSLNLIDWIVGKLGENGGPQKQQSNLISGNPNMSNKLSLQITASMKFWSCADRDDKSTFPETNEIVQWFENKGLSTSSAEKAASLIRPEWAGAGRKPEK